MTAFSVGTQQHPTEEIPDTGSLTRKRVSIVGMFTFFTNAQISPYYRHTKNLEDVNLR